MLRKPVALTDPDIRTVSAHIIISFKNLVDSPNARITVRPEIVSPYIEKSGELVMDATQWPL